jgi:exosortase
MTQRNAYFLLAVTGSILIFWTPLRELLTFSLHDDTYSYIPLIPLISVCLIYLERKRIFRDVRYGRGGGLALILCAVALFSFGKRHTAVLTQGGFPPLTILSIVVLWSGIFMLCYGRQALQSALFPMLFLILMIPFPVWLHGESVSVLRKGSAHAAALMLKLLGVPVYQEGLKLVLPRINIDVEEQCSSIRSSLALFITALLISHLFLRSIWSKLCACGAVFPITIFKNGLRIVTLSFLLVRPRFSSFTTTLHKHAGIPFSLLAIALLLPIIWALRQLENRAGKNIPPPINL